MSAAVVGSSRRARNDMVNLLATPKSDNPWLKRYSYWLKFEGNLFMGIFFVGYLIKWGVAWHDAGTMWSLSDVKFSA